GPVPLNRISDFAEKEFKQQIAAIPDVGGVQFGGLRSRNIRVWIDAAKLAGYNLAAEDVVQAIQRQHAELPAGYIQSNLVEFNVRLSIPTSLVGTFFVLKYGMKLIGVQPFTINLMTLLGLSLSVGVVVDDAILVLENIYRHRERGTNRKQAALVGAREISFAA